MNTQHHAGKLAALALSLIVYAAPAQAQTVSDFMARMRARWNTPSEPFRIIDNVYYVGTAGLASFLVTSPNGHVLINSALPEGAALIKANIEKLGVKLTDIKFLLSSEAHYDHAGAWVDLKKETGAQLVASAADRPLLEGGSYPGQEDNAELKFPPVSVDRVVGQGDRITVGNLTLTAHLTPGHSPGCTTWSTTAREKQSDHTVVFFCSMSVAINRLAGNLTYPAIVDDYRKSFDLASRMTADVFLAPHPEMFKMEEKRLLIGKSDINPFIKAGEFHAYISSAQKAFDEGLAKQKAAAEGGK